MAEPHQPLPGPDPTLCTDMQHPQPRCVPPREGRQYQGVGSPQVPLPACKRAAQNRRL